MKLRRLRIHNIASIADARLDFDASPLAEAGIFLIAGPTGAGKSTLLDAICVALYGDAPRFTRTPRSTASRDLPTDDDVKPNDVRNLLRHGAGEGSVTLAFCGSGGEEYEAVWRVRRTRNRPSGKLMKQTHSLVRLSDGMAFEKKAEINREVIAAIGLDYDQFCRTVMLPQGEFTRFLNAKDGDKAALLEKITRVDIYSAIGAEIFNRAKAHDEAYQLARRLADETAALPHDEELELKRRLAMAKAEVAESEKLTAALRRLGEKRQQLADAEAKIESGRRDMEDARRDAGSHEITGLRLMVERWSATTDVRAALAVADKALKDRAVAKKHLADVSGEVAAAKEAAGRLAADVDRLVGLVAKLGEAASVDEGREQALANAPAILKELAAVNEHKALLAKTSGDLAARRGELKILEASLGRLRSHQEEAARLANEKRVAFEALKDSVNNFAVAMRATLAEGCRCPVCRQKVEVMPAAEEALQGAADLAGRESREAAKCFEEATLKLKSAEADYKSLRDKIIPSAEKLETMQRAALESHTGNLDRLSKPVRALYKLDPGADISGLAKQLSDEAESLTARKVELERVSGELRLKRERHSAAMAELVRIRNIAGEYIDENATPVNSRRRITEIAGDVAAFASAITSADRLYEESDAVVKEFMAAVGNDFTLDELRELSLRSHGEVMVVSQRIEELERRVAMTRRVMAERLVGLRAIRRRRIEGLDYEPSPDDADVLLSEALGRGREAGRVVVECGSRLAQSEENRRLRASREAEADRLQAVADRWDSLNRLLGSATGEKMRRIAQSLILSSLVERANVYMDQLSDRYRLSVSPGTFNILVEDAFQGYATRPASTVSGGESFLVSLALALALSDIGSTLSVDTLFIDEGFGSLSSDALEHALSTLARLRESGNRRVGIISHVAELRDRIDVHIEVSRDGIRIVDR